MYIICINMTEVNLSLFVDRLFHENFSPIPRSEICSKDWREIFMKQSANKYT